MQSIKLKCVTSKIRLISVELEKRDSKRIPGASRRDSCDPAAYAGTPVSPDARSSPCNHRRQRQSVCHRIAHTEPQQGDQPARAGTIPVQYPKHAMLHPAIRSPPCRGIIKLNLHCQVNRSNRDLLVAMQMHAAHCRGVSLQRMHTGSAVHVPHLKRTIRAARDDDVAGHLGRPDATSVANQCAKALNEKGKAFV